MVKIHYNTKPPIWDKLAKAFVVEWVTGVCVTYGAEIYVAGDSIANDLLVHELVHVEQQRRSSMSPDEIIEKYIHDVVFRYQCELEAVKVHNMFLRETVLDKSELEQKIARNKRSFLLTTGIELPDFV